VIGTTAKKRALIAVLGFFVVGSALGQSPARIRVTTWNLEWFPNGSPREAPPEKQAQRIEAAAVVLRKLDPDILLLQEMRDYDACIRLGGAIHPGARGRDSGDCGERACAFGGAA